MTSRDEYRAVVTYLSEEREHRFVTEVTAHEFAGILVWIRNNLRTGYWSYSFVDWNDKSSRHKVRLSFDDELLALECRLTFS